MTYTLRLKGSSGEVEVACNANETMLGALLANSADVQYLCRAGICGLCKAKLVSGAVNKLYHRATALSDEEEATGHILLCRSQPQQDCTVHPVQSALSMSFDSGGRYLAITHDTGPGQVDVRLQSPEPFKAFRPGHLAWIHSSDGSAPPAMVCFVRQDPDAPSVATFQRMTPVALYDSLDASATVTLDGPHGSPIPPELFAHPYIAVLEASAWPLLAALCEGQREAGAPRALQVIFIGREVSAPVPLIEAVSEGWALLREPAQALKDHIRAAVSQLEAGARLKVLLRGSIAFQDLARRAISGTGVRAWDVSGDSRIDLNTVSDGNRDASPAL